MTTPYVPLYSALRPQTFDDIAGQESVIKLIRSFLSKDFLPSMIFYGPPGTGKTTIARIASEQFGAKMYRFSAVVDGVSEIKKKIYADSGSVLVGRQIVFIDEVHRFNKAQQDIFLPMIESEGVIFIGATTENPSFYINDKFSKQSSSETLSVLKKAASHLNATIPEDLQSVIAQESGGDLRIAISILESAFHLSSNGVIKKEDVMELIENPQKYDKKGDYHYRTISAFIKSLRGSDPDAALYYLVKMVESGDDPLFLLRRMIIFASEDVGNADPRALQLAVSALEGFKAVGFPEGKIILSHIVTYLATAPKSNASYMALKEAEDFYRNNPDLKIPQYLINSSSLAPDEEKGEYRYPHDHKDQWVDQRYFPGEGEPASFYKMKNSGYESKVKAYWERIKKGV
jgi:putative ATPase